MNPWDGLGGTEGTPGGSGSGGNSGGPTPGGSGGENTLPEPSSNKRGRESMEGEESSGEEAPKRVKAKVGSVTESDGSGSDNDRTPTNGSVEGDSTPTDESANDEADLRTTLDLVKRAAKGEDIGRTSLDQIKEEFSYIFDTSRTKKEAYNDIINNLEGELGLLGKRFVSDMDRALDTVASESSSKGSDAE